MHARAIAKRGADATNRMRGATLVIADRLGIDPPVFKVHTPGGPEVQQLFARETIADYLEHVAEALGERHDEDMAAMGFNVNQKLPARESTPAKGRKGTADAVTEGVTDEPIHEAVPQLAGDEQL